MLLVERIRYRLRHQPQISKRKRIGNDRAPAVCSKTDHYTIPSIS
jgi:hypothetical protein